jgi:type VI secretion system protein ImpF
MAELTAAERLQPSLLDRLTDTDPESKVESRERRVLSLQRLRAAVLRDLAWLMNTGCLETTEDLEAFAHVRDSVLNYGIPDLSGMTLSGAETVRIEKAVREAIVRYEPRISSRSLRVTVDIDRMKMNRNFMTFHIEGELWAQPTPISLFLKTEVDLETGDVDLTER